MLKKLFLKPLPTFTMIANISVFLNVRQSKVHRPSCDFQRLREMFIQNVKVQKYVFWRLSQIN